MIAQNQEILKIGLVVSHNGNADVANIIAALKDDQMKLYQTTRDNIDLIAGYISEVARNQEILKTGLVVSHNETAKVANNVAELGKVQTEFSKTMQANNEQLTEKVSDVQSSAKTISAEIPAAIEQLRKEIASDATAYSIDE